jgi:hypothetical protein
MIQIASVTAVATVFTKSELASLAHSYTPHAASRSRSVEDLSLCACAHGVLAHPGWLYQSVRLQRTAGRIRLKCTCIMVAWST